MAAEIKKELGVDSQVVRGSGGIFKVTANNQLLFDKHAEGRFPSEKEIVEKLRGLV